MRPKQTIKPTQLDTLYGQKKKKKKITSEKLGRDFEWMTSNFYNQ